MLFSQDLVSVVKQDKTDPKADNFIKADPDYARALQLNMEKHRYILESAENKILVSPNNAIDVSGTRSYIDNFENKCYEISEIEEKIANITPITPVEDAKAAQVITALGHRLKKSFIEEQRRSIHFYSSRKFT